MSQFLSVLSIVGTHFINHFLPETLAKVAKCSSEVNQIAVPVLERKMSNAEEMYQLVLRVFPGILKLPADETAEYYRRLQNSYYYPDPELGPCDIEVSHMVGSIITAPNPYNEARSFMLYVPGCANAAVKRARVLKAIGEWTTIYTKRGVSIGADFTDAITKLDALALALRTDFAVYENTVDSHVRDRYFLGGGW